MQVEDVKARLDAYVDEVWEEAVADIRTLVQIDSVDDSTHATEGMPYGPGPAEALSTALGIAERLGLESHNCAGHIGYADLPGESARQIATIAHSDIVPVGDGWSVPALDVTRREGYLMGRGVLDDKGPLVLSLYAAHFFARMVKETGVPLPKTLRCIVGAAEETTMADLSWYLEHFEAPEFAFTPDADFPLICGEKGILHGHFELPWSADGVVASLQGGTVANAVAGRAAARLRGSVSLPVAEDIAATHEEDGLVLVTAVGKGGHASIPAGTKNAIALLAQHLLQLEGLAVRERALLELASLVCSTWDGVALGIDASDEKFGALTCVGGTVSTGKDVARLSVDIRYPTTTSAEVLVTRLSELAARFGGSFVLDGNKDPFYVEPTSPEIEALLTTYREYARADGQAFTIGGGTYARKFPKACAFGPNEPDYPNPAWVGAEHGPDEAIAEELLKRALKIYIVSIARLMEL